MCKNHLCKCCSAFGLLEISSKLLILFGAEFYACFKYLPVKKYAVLADKVNNGFCNGIIQIG